MAYDDHYTHRCPYCNDQKVRDSWERIGGTIGEKHYVCHRKACRAKREMSQRARRAEVARRRKEKESHG